MFGSSAFNKQYRCYSVSMLPGRERLDVERGGKIIMPKSAEQMLIRLDVDLPMLFKLTNRKTDQITHCGVFEFEADEGKVYLPYWMMRNLLLGEGDLLRVESASLPVATFSKFQPQSEDFLDITDHKAVLEHSLGSFKIACLTSGDVVAITYNDRVYELRVLETKPENAVSLFNCDLNVEFAAPVGYSQPIRPSNEEQADQVMDTFDPSQFTREVEGFVAFTGSGSRLDGKAKKQQDPEPAPKTVAYQRGIPDYDYEIGSLRFLRYSKAVEEKDTEEESQFQAFSGSGQSLRRRKSQKERYSLSNLQFSHQ